MSETQRTFFKRRRKAAPLGIPSGRGFSCGLLIAGGLLLLLIVVVVRVLLPSPPEPDGSRVKATPAPRSGRVHPNHRTASETQKTADWRADAFYRTIINNNLFRPLGWTRPVPAPAYRLTGTLIPRDSKTPPQALIIATDDPKTHIVSPGDKLATDTTVIEIRLKHVILDSGGQRITLKLDTSAWLSTSSRHFSRPR